MKKNFSVSLNNFIYFRKRKKDIIPPSLNKEEIIELPVQKLFSEVIDEMNDTSFNRSKDNVGRDWPSHSFNCFKSDLIKKFRVS
jgi:hypothetical protein